MKQELMTLLLIINMAGIIFSKYEVVKIFNAIAFGALLVLLTN